IFNLVVTSSKADEYTWFNSTKSIKVSKYARELNSFVSLSLFDIDSLISTKSKEGFRSTYMTDTPINAILSIIKLFSFILQNSYISIIQKKSYDKAIQGGTTYDIKII